MGLSVSLKITRQELDESPLELNDGAYLVASDGLRPGDIGYRREQVSSPWVDGEFTVHRHKESPEAQIVINVQGDSQSQLKAHIETLVKAFTQDEFDLELEINGAKWFWRGEAADHAIGWGRERRHALSVPVGFQFPRYPVYEPEGF